MGWTAAAVERAMTYSVRHAAGRSPRPVPPNRPASPCGVHSACATLRLARQPWRHTPAGRRPDSGRPAELTKEGALDFLASLYPCDSFSSTGITMAELGRAAGDGSRPTGRSSRGPRTRPWCHLLDQLAPVQTAWTRYGG